MPVLQAFFGAGLTLLAALCLGRIVCRRAVQPVAITLAAGAAILHLAVFLLLYFGVARWPAFTAIAVLAAVVSKIWQLRIEIPKPPLWISALCLPFAIVYLVNALTPEGQADANLYHLLPAIEAARSGSWSNEITFYDRLPHATELLFAFAYAFGGVPAAKLVHLSFFALTLPLIAAVGRSLGIPPNLASMAAALYFVTPVAGVSATTAYNDAALVFVTVAAIWTIFETRPALAGLLAGTCYAIKMTGGLALIPVAIRYRRSLPIVAMCAALMICPWLIRNAIDTGNPVAPFFNDWFPNDYFYSSVERELTTNLRTYGVALSDRWWEVTFGDRLTGIIGPIYLLAPVALIFAKRRPVRIALGLAVLFSTGWYLNAGARFLLPALPFVALTFAASFSTRVFVPILLAHAVLSWPWIIPLYSRTWRIYHFPVAAAFGLESKEAYLTRISADYRIAKLVESNTDRHSVILDMYGLHRAHIDRRVIGQWQSARGYRVFSALALGVDLRDDALETWSAHTPKHARAIKLHNVRTLNELILMSAGERLRARRRWTLTSNVKASDLPLAFDHNYASAWLGSAKSEISIDFTGVEQLDEIQIVVPRSTQPVPPSIALQQPDGAWTAIELQKRTGPALNLRLEAGRFVRKMGITHILTPVAFDGIGKLGYQMVDPADNWGFEVAGNVDTYYLLRVGSDAPKRD